MTKSRTGLTPFRLFCLAACFIALTSDSAPNLTLDAIYWSESDPIVTIGGENYHIGDKILDFHIVDIKKTTVILEDITGNRTVLEFYAHLLPEKERQEVDKDIALAEQRAEEAIKRMREAERLAKKEKFERINKVCIDAGYQGYRKASIPSVILTTQQKGGLEEYLNWVVDYPAGEMYAFIKAISILDDAVLYSYSDSDGHFIVHVGKEPGKIYQEGQALERNFYVFSGMYTYISTSGARKSVPSFKLANITL